MMIIDQSYCFSFLMNYFLRIATIDQFMMKINFHKFEQKVPFSFDLIRNYLHLHLMKLKLS
jgi:hypothetical protein